MGGRWSVLSAVGLLPMAVAGVDIRALLQGAMDAAAALQSRSAGGESGGAVRRGAQPARRAGGFAIENLVSFEPALSYFGRWWSQLFAESEGKDGLGIFPIASNYSEDLHASGQYIQQGRRMIFETFLDARFAHPELAIPLSRVVDGFDYLDGERYDDAEYGGVPGGIPGACGGWGSLPAVAVRRDQPGPVRGAVLHLHAELLPVGGADRGRSFRPARRGGV